MPSPGTARAHRRARRANRRQVRPDLADAAKALRPQVRDHAAGLPPHVQPDPLAALGVRSLRRRRVPPDRAPAPPAHPATSPPAPHPKPPGDAPAPTPPTAAPTPSEPAQSPAGSPTPDPASATPPPASGHTTGSPPTPTPPAPPPARSRSNPPKPRSTPTPPSAPEDPPPPAPPPPAHTPPAAPSAPPPRNPHQPHHRQPPRPSHVPSGTQPSAGRRRRAALGALVPLWGYRASWISGNDAASQPPRGGIGSPPGAPQHRCAIRDFVCAVFVAPYRPRRRYSQEILAATTTRGLPNPRPPRLAVARRAPTPAVDLLEGR